MSSEGQATCSAAASPPAASEFRERYNLFMGPRAQAVFGAIAKVQVVVIWGPSYWEADIVGMMLTSSHPKCPN